jgi:hypothetical protein
MNDPYFHWLCKRVNIPHEKNYMKMAHELHCIKFEPGSAIETDSNRANDGLRQRVIFMDRYGPQGSSSNRGACTMLEFLIGLAQRMSFIMGSEENDLHTAHYFWKLIGNLRLLKLSDDRYDELNGDFFVQEAVDRVLFRTYERDGRGGLFPLKRCFQDQRTVEIWYQMQNWLQESDEFRAE